MKWRKRVILPKNGKFQNFNLLTPLGVLDQNREIWTSNFAHNQVLTAPGASIC